MPSTPTHAPMTGEDIERMLAENGANGAFEIPGTETPTERWMFGRFHGATDDADMYLSRVGLGPYDTDVETLVAWLKAPRNIVGAILTLSPPGTGKTALIEASVTYLGTDSKGKRKKNAPEMMTVLCTPDHTRESLFRIFVGEGKGDCINHGHVDGTDCEGGCNRSPFTLGPIPYAAKHGMILYLDEVWRLDDGVFPVLYPLADGRHALPEGNVDGSPLVIHKDFRLVLSSNPMVRGASFPEPMASRCAGTTIHVHTDAALLRDLGIDESIIGAWSALGEAGLFQPQVRELRVADYWMETDVAQAASALIPEHCPESERQAVTNMVRSFLGGDLPADGRLVVK